MADSYRTVADAIMARIRSGQLPPHARLRLDEFERAHGKAVTEAAVAWLAAHRWVVHAPGLGVRVSGSPPSLDERPGPAPDAAPADLAARVEQLSGQVEQLSGQVEELTGQVRRLLARVEALERRDGSLEG